MKMIYLFMRFRVENYATWKEGFDNHLPARQAGGSTDEIHILRNVDDRNDVTIILGWHNLKTARLFAQSVSLQMFIQNAGVLASSNIQLLEQIS